MSSDVVYMAEVHKYNDTNDIIKTYKYVGATSTSFKKRYANHKYSFSNIKLKSATSLSKLIHELKDSGKRFSIDWKLIKNARSYSPGNRICDLCVTEALII